MNENELSERLNEHEKFIKFLTDTLAMWRKLHGRFAEWHDYDLASFRRAKTSDISYNVLNRDESGLYMEFSLDFEENDTEIVPYSFILTAPEKQAEMVAAFEQEVYEACLMRKTDQDEQIERQERKDLERLLNKYPLRSDTARQ